MSVRIHHGDCLIELPKLALAGERFHACVTDPPYGLEFMGKEWDGADGFRRSLVGAGITDVSGKKALFIFQLWCEAWARAVFDVLLPGAYLLAFGGTRTSHRMVCGIEDAGFEIRDTMAWLYGSGFPKSLDVSKAIDKAAGAQREIEATGPAVKRMIPGADQNKAGWEKNSGREYTPSISKAATDDAKRWEGWGTALKPALELICVARKPLIGTVVANVLTHGTGALNIDASRVPADASIDDPRLNGVGTWATDKMAENVYNGSFPGRSVGSSALGRFPANVLHDGSEEVLAAFPDAPGQLFAVGPQHGDGGGVNALGKYGPRPSAAPRLETSKSASRFFYTSKAGADDRQGSKHPTVKPTDLMRYLVTLVTPPGGTILDPFCGTGSTLVAADQAQFNAVGIEREAEYVNDALRKFERDAGLFGELSKS